VRVVPDTRAGFANGACGRVEWGGATIGHLGRIDRRSRKNSRSAPPRRRPSSELAPLIANTQHVPQLRPLPRFPAVTRDMSFVVDDSTRYESFDALVRKLALPT
jgi:phenylalanyl-tRNA synthetase beta subunit